MVPAMQLRGSRRVLRAATSAACALDRVALIYPIDAEVVVKVDHTVTDQSSILRFIEDNWQTGTIGNFSFDEKAGSLMNMLSFVPQEERASRLFLDPVTGEKR